MIGALRAHPLLAALLLLAAALRLFVFSLSEPHNAYDDHLEAIAWYATHGARPAADACWQCYQPPAYYAVASGVLRLAAAATGDNPTAWKIVQLLSVLFSLAALALCARILALAGSRRPGPRLCALAVLVFLPREVYTSVFISNDGMLVLAVTASVWLYLEAVARDVPSRGWLAALLAAVAWSAWTKQHGLIVALLPAALLAQEWGRLGDRRPVWLGVLALGLAIAAGDPIYKLVTTGHPLISNQHYFDWPSVQRPGSVAATSFLDFRLLSLFAEPRLSPATIDSFWTQLFAKLWFDYDPKFLVDTPGTRALAAGWYGVGLILTCVWAAGCVVAWRRWRGSRALVLLWVQLAFLAVPLLQSLRFPYYSSMKATFFLPAISVAALLLSFGFERFWSRRSLRVLAVAACATTALLFAWECVLMREQIRDAMLASLRGGKLWPFPPGWGTR